jgi:hypothetical protein
MSLELKDRSVSLSSRILLPLDDLRDDIGPAQQGEFVIFPPVIKRTDPQSETVPRSIN